MATQPMTQAHLTIDHVMFYFPLFVFDVLAGTRFWFDRLLPNR